MAKRILVIDDSMTTRAMLKNILTNVGYYVEALSDATEALVRLKMNHYDLIITDLEMPKMDGIKFIETLQNDEMYADIPVIVISSQPKEKVAAKLRPLRIEGYIQKELFDQNNFVENVKLILSKHHD